MKKYSGGLTTGIVQKFGAHYMQKLRKHFTYSTCGNWMGLPNQIRVHPCGNFPPNNSFWWLSLWASLYSSS